MKKRNSLSHYVAVILINVMFWHPVVVFADGITLAPNAGNTSLDKAGNGVPVINIATPNGSGLSHNTFTDYNVDSRGIILNNATEKLQSTQLGGLIVGNPNLRDQAARLIINEVNGGSPSRLEGYTEVAGQAANVVVANPYGITCNGCGFINSPRVTLSTGRPVIENGDLDHFAVDRGKVTIEGLGLDATQVDQFDIITRAAQLNAELHANELNIITGANDVDAKTLEAVSRQGQGEIPELAIDSSALGGMYAGRIKLVGTEGGVGVRLAGDMAASAGNIRIDVAGNLSVTNATSTGRMIARANSATLHGDMHATDGIAISATETIANQHDLTSAGDIALKAGRRIVNTGQVIAGIDDDTRQAGADLNLKAEHIDNRGRLDATARLAIDSQETSNSGQLLASEIAIVTQKRVTNTAAIQAERIRLETETLTNRGETATLAASTTLDLDIRYLDNLGGTLQFAKGQNVQLELERLDNTAGTFLLDGGALQVWADELTNRGGQLAAWDIAIEAGSLDNADAGSIAATGGDLALDVNGTLDNSAGQLQAANGLFISAGDALNSGGVMSGDDVALVIAGDLGNRDGVISAENGDLALTVGGVLDNTQGSLQSRAGSLILVAGDADNRGGVMVAEQAIEAQVKGTFDNGNQGALMADSVGLQAERLKNRSGKLVGDSAVLKLGNFDNSQGLVSAEQSLQTDLAGTLNNRQGRIQVTSGDLVLNGGTALDNTQGILVAERLQLQGVDSIVNHQGQLIAGAIDITAGALNNGDAGLVASGEGGTHLALELELDNRGGKLQSEQGIDITAQRIDNSDGVIIGDGLFLQAKQLINQGGALLSGAAGIAVALADIADASLDNRDGVIDAQGGTLSFDANDGIIDNRNGSLSAERLELVAGTLLNAGGQLASGPEGLSLTAQRIDNRDGLLIAEGGALKASFTVLQNQGGTIQADTASFMGDTLYNSQQGLIASLDGLVRMVLSEGLDNRSGQVIANGALDIDPPFIDNRHGQLAGRTIRLEAGHLNNAHGMIEAAEGLAVTANTLTNIDGDLRALGGDETRIEVAGTLDNNSGRIEAASADFRLDAGHLRNAQGHLLHAGAGLFRLIADTFIGQGGQLQGTANGLVTIREIVSLGRWLFNGALDIDSDQGLRIEANERIATADNLSLNLANLVNLGKLVANDNLRLDASGDINNRGLISTQADLSVSARHLNQRDGRLASGGTSTYRLSGNLDNLGRLTGVGNVDIRADYINNRGTLGSQRDLRIVSRGSIDNRPDTLLFSGGDMTLRGTRLFNRYGDIYSRGYLDFARDDQHNRANSLENRSGTIEAERGVRLYTEYLKNTKDKFEIVYQSTGNYIEIERSLNPGYDVFSGTHQCSGSSQMTGPNSCRIRNSKKDDYDYIVAVHELGKNIVTKNSVSGFILSGGDISIQSLVVENSNSIISANGNVLIDTSSFENLGGGQAVTDRERIYEFTMPAYVTRTRSERNNEVVYYSVANEDIGDFSYNVAEWNRRNGTSSDGSLLSLPEQLNQNTKKSDITKHIDQGGGSGAIIQAGNQVFINAGNIAQNGTIKNNTRTQLTGSLGSTATNGPVNSLNVTLNRRSGEAETQHAEPFDKASRSDASATANLAPISQENVASYYETTFERVAPTKLSSFRLPQGQYGLFVRNTSPQSRYLIETNPEFTSIDRFMGSSYLLDKLGYTDDSAYKLLGDGRYESRLIRDAVIANTGQRFLEQDLTDDYAQYRYLMDNAVAAKDALQLTVGVGLTSEQTAALTHDIVWMEEQVVDGQTVLAPVLYLAQVDSRNVRGNSLIQGRDIELIAGGDLVNVGTIRATNDLSVTSGGSILQGGLIEAGKRLDLSARDTIRNAMAGEIRGGRVSLEALKGDIVNDRTAITAGYEKDYQTYLDQGGLISARDSLEVTAGRDIINRAEIESQGDATLTAGRDIVNAAVEDAWHEARAYGSGKASESASQLGASLTVGGDIALAAGRDVAVTASDVAAEGALDVKAARDIRLEAGENTTREGRSRTVSQVGSLLASGGDATLSAGRDVHLVASTIDSDADLTVTAANDIVLDAGVDSRETKTLTRSRYSKSLETEQIGSTLNADGDIALEAGRNVTAVASRVEAGDGLAIQAGRNILLSSAENVQSDEYQTRTTQQIDRQVRQQGSELVAGGDLSLTAGNDLRMVASEAQAGDEAYLFAGNDVELLAANNQDYTLYEKEEDGGLFGSSSYQRDEVNDLRAVGSQVESGGDLTVVSGGDQTYQTARLESGDDLTLASLGDIRFEAASDIHTESHEESSGNFAWQSSEGKGRTDETLRQSELIAKGSIAIQAANRVIVDVPEVNQQTVSRTIDAMVAADPDLAWLEAMEARGDVDWRRVKEIHDSWSYEQSGLGAGAMLAIAIVAATFVGPAVSGYVSAASGSAVVGAAAAGAAASMATTGTVGLINNGGNLGAALETTFSSDSLRGALLAAASAGMAQGVDGFWGGSTDVASGTTQNLDLGNLSDIGRFAGNRATQAIANAGLKSAINGGSLGDNLEAGLQGTVAHIASGVLFNAVGDFAIEQGWPEGGPQKIALHALVGGLVAETAGGDFRDGAIAAGANEALVDHLAAAVNDNPKLLILASQITGIVAAELSEGDVNQGAQIAGQATTYNYLSHWQEAKKEAELTACKGDPLCKMGTRAKWAMVDAQQDAGLIVGAAGGIALSAKEAADGIYALVTNFSEVMDGLRQLATSPEFRQQFGESYLNDLQVRADRLAEAYETAGWEGSITAGVEGGRFAAELAGVLTAVKGGAQLVARLPSSAGKVIGGINAANNPVISLPRVGSATKVDDMHSFNDIIDNYAGMAEKFLIPTKGEGGKVVRTSELRQIKGGLNGRDGVFEWIIDGGEITHRRFIPGGEVTGHPNQTPKPKEF